MQEQYLAPGEVVRWTAPQAPESYFVAGLREDGKPAGRWPVWVRVLVFPFQLVWTAFLRLAEFLACFSDFDFSDFPRRKGQPVVLVFGGSPECMAVFRSRPSSDAGFHGVWMLTDRRFVAASFESMPFRIEFEVPADQLRFHPHVERRFSRKFRPRNGTYHQVLLPDGSGFAFAPGAVSFTAG
ncbi:hypothetical protein [Glycomyces algeriensis]|uniref:Uncharacterized protein n=1 Tax=Glycomyces algeriensis TaxID=256037 RepID=A0A9W6GDV3_9ACTN|nr:hypothetical protein [Glycomyces algeriensis]MDA1366535.1 hypothetical protein [Glycomyces algeriensis]MDR7352193.1 hypothetical protein [Glycomyces algeriensis]GLI44928.1 hypothetical protein GALLR39Z86_47780 [Glycomyces algeriensis]